eukprot:jgi/Ulvmu1/7510/UM037_0054.1
MQPPACCVNGIRRQWQRARNSLWLGAKKRLPRQPASCWTVILDLTPLLSPQGPFSTPLPHLDTPPVGGVKVSSVQERHHAAHCSAATSCAPMYALQSARTPTHDDTFYVVCSMLLRVGGAISASNALPHDSATGRTLPAAVAFPCTPVMICKPTLSSSTLPRQKPIPSSPFVCVAMCVAVPR